MLITDYALKQNQIDPKVPKLLNLYKNFIQKSIFKRDHIKPELLQFLIDEYNGITKTITNQKLKSDSQAAQFLAQYKEIIENDGLKLTQISQNVIDYLSNLHPQVTDTELRQNAIALLNALDKMISVHQKEE